MSDRQENPENQVFFTGVTLELIDRLLADLMALRAVLSVESDGCQATAEDDADDMIDTATASDRFGIPRDTIRWLCDAKGLGEKRGGRWMVSTMALQQYNKREKRE